MRRRQTSDREIEFSLDAEDETLGEETFGEYLASLLEANIGLRVGVDPNSAAGAQAISVAINALCWYDLKPDAIAWALECGATGGWGMDESGNYVFYLETGGGGQTSYHDPGEDLWWALEGTPWQDAEYWWPWTERLRKESIFDEIEEPTLLEKHWLS